MLKLTFQQQILGGFISFLLCGFILTFTSYSAIDSLQGDEAGLAVSRKALLKLNRVQQLISNCEIGAKSYLLSGNEALLEPYNFSHKAVTPAIQELRLAVAYNPESASRIDSLEYYAAEKIGDLADMIKATNEGSFNDGIQLALQAKGNLISKKLNSLIAKITESQNELLAVGEAQELQLNKRSSIILFSLLILEVIILAFLIKYITRTFKAQKKTEEEVLRANEGLKAISEENISKNWVLSGLSTLDKTMRGIADVNELATKVITKLAKHVDAQVATLYTMNDSSQSLSLAASYAFTERKHNLNYIKPGEGLIGQAVLEKQAILFNNLPADYVKITSGTGETVPHSLLIQPFLFENEIKGVIELGFASPISDVKKEFIEKVVDAIGVAFNTAQSRVQIQALLESTQQQAEELEAQQEELRTTNEELITKTLTLQSSEEELRVQQEELKFSHAAIAEKAAELEARNRQIGEAKEAMSLKAEELELAGKYKSEFLANMSHELRTPLNSILILARILKENKKNNLDADQLKYATVIHNSGNDLLSLINDILDLSKIESGKMDLDIDKVEISEVQRDMEFLFKEVANTKKINYKLELDSTVPKAISSDKMRLQQVLKNLLSNAFKFTPAEGAVSLSVSLANKNQKFKTENLSKIENQDVIAFSVKDSGIGIPEDKQKLIFEAFQQADGSTSRKYGGTGLGLSISRELANLLGGEIQVSSQVNQGSTFTLYIPASADLQSQVIDEPNPETKSPIMVERDSTSLTPVLKTTENGEKLGKEHIMLIIEDDANFAAILENYAKERGFKPVLAEDGEKGLQMALDLVPDSVILDIMLPGIDGWGILRKLKENPQTQHIPVHMISAGDGGLAKAKNEGAAGFLQKPIGKDGLAEVFNLLSKAVNSLKKVLVVEDNEIQSENLKSQLVSNGVHVVQVYNGEEALNVLKDQQDFDCIILDVNLPDISGLDLLDKIKAQNSLAEIPVIINTAMEMDETRVSRVLKHTHSMVMKINRPNDRLMDEVNLFMNKVKNNHTKPLTGAKPAAKTGHPISLNKALSRKSVLLVDDDMRNIFALSSALEGYDMDIEIAVNGIDALKKLDTKPDTDIVLMDIMMPEMDGYEAIREIRKQSRFNNLPILSLTAKAMKNDREKCIEAGANDYISKPVDMDKLVSMLRVWLS